MKVDLHEIEATKARISLEVSAFRRELDILKSDKETFLEDRRKEAEKIVADIMEASHKLLSEAKDSTSSVEMYLKTLSTYRKGLEEATEAFQAYRDEEIEKIAGFRELADKNVSEMTKKTESLRLERMRLQTAKNELELASEQARKDFEKARLEREKLAKNKDYIAFLKKNYGRRKEGSEPRDDASVR